MLHLPRKKSSLNYIFPPYQPIHVSGLSSEKKSDDSIIEGSISEEQTGTSPEEPVKANITDGDTHK